MSSICEQLPVTDYFLRSHKTSICSWICRRHPLRELIFAQISFPHQFRCLFVFYIKSIIYLPKLQRSLWLSGAATEKKRAPRRLDIDNGAGTQKRSGQQIDIPSVPNAPNIPDSSGQRGLSLTNKPKEILQNPSCYYLWHFNPNGSLASCVHNTLSLLQ